MSTLSCQSGVPASPLWSPDCPEQCEQHGESLCLFCVDDLEPLCEQCAAVGHAEHRVYLLTEAAADCKEELKTSVNGLKKRMTHFRTVRHTFEHASRHNQAEAKLTEEQMKRDFASLHQFLREEEAARLLALREKREEKKRAADERVDTMNQMIAALEENIQLIEKELDAGGDGVEFLKHYKDTTNSTCPDDKDVRKPLIDVAKHTGNLRYEVWDKMKDIAPYTPLTLDPRTAGQSLRVSPGLNHVYVTPNPPQSLEQRPGAAVPDNPERFHPYSCVLAREGFESGVHCWDVEVGDNNNWTVGVAARSLPRKAEFEACPEAGLWCISLRDDEYRALTTPSESLNFDTAHHLNRVQMRLDWDEGTLEFQNAETAAHLYTFRHRFAEKVYPYFESISSRGGLRVLAQRVEITLGSDDVPEEDTTSIDGEDQGLNGESCPEGGVDNSSTNGKSEMSDCQHLTENKTSAISHTREENQEQLIKTKLPVEEKAKNDKPVVKIQKRKPRFSVNYHVSLNKVLNVINSESANQQQF